MAAILKTTNLLETYRLWAARKLNYSLPGSKVPVIIRQVVIFSTCKMFDARVNRRDIFEVIVRQMDFLAVINL